MAEKLTQQQFDEIPGIIVHLLIDETKPTRALCSGKVIDPNRWLGSNQTRKQCQACYYAALRQLRKPPKEPTRDNRTI